MNTSKADYSRARSSNSSVGFYRLVIDTIKDVEGDRKCFRMIGGVLVERSVKEVLPALKKNKEQVSCLLLFEECTC